MNINKIAEETFNTAKARGFYNGDISIYDISRCLDSENAEMVEAHNRGDYTGGTDSRDMELIDRCIVCLSDLHYFGVDIKKMLRKKMRINKQRAGIKETFLDKIKYLLLRV